MSEDTWGSLALRIEHHNGGLGRSARARGRVASSISSVLASGKLRTMPYESVVMAKPKPPDLAMASGQRAVEMFALHDAARFGDLTSLKRLVDVAQNIGGRLAEVHAASASALLASDAAELFSTAEQFEAIGALLSAADAAAQAAALFRTADDRRHALDAAADRLAAACGGVRTPALEMASQPLQLSPREREIANFASRGLSNRDIADRPVVSSRTVEGHIFGPASSSTSPIARDWPWSSAESAATKTAVNVRRCRKYSVGRLLLTGILST
jgi:Bacterial regulatory proteins, luxR family